MPILGILAMVVISISQPNKDNATLFSTIIGFIVLAIPMLLNYSATVASVQASKINTEKIAEVHTLVNGQSAKLERAISDEAFARGEKAAEVAATVMAAKVEQAIKHATGEHKPISSGD